MIVIDDVVHHTGEGSEGKKKIALSKFEVTCKKNSGETWGEPGQFDATDEADAIAQYVAKNDIKLHETSGKKFKAVVVKEQRVEAVAPPKPKVKAPRTPKKASE